jgi:hypothetical protein
MTNCLKSSLVLHFYHRMKDRLLIIDAKTIDIVSMYVKTKICLENLELDELLQIQILDLIKNYLMQVFEPHLRTRSDVPRVIIKIILDSHDSEAENRLSDCKRLLYNIS